MLTSVFRVGDTGVLWLSGKGSCIVVAREDGAGAGVGVGVGIGVLGTELGMLSSVDAGSCVSLGRLGGCDPIVVNIVVSEMVEVQVSVGVKSGTDVDAGANVDAIVIAVSVNSSLQ